MKNERGDISGRGDSKEALRLQAQRIDEKIASLPPTIDPVLNREISREAWRDYISDVTSSAFVNSPEGPIGMARGLSSSLMYEKF